MVTATSGEAPPAIVKNLMASDVTMTSAKLNWTATGDDGRVGTAKRFELRYATWSMTLENLPFAEEVAGMPVPHIAGTSQSVTVNGLALGTLYRFAMIVYDEQGKASYLSNVALLETDPKPDFDAPAAVDTLIAETITNGNAAILGTVTNQSSEQTARHRR